MDGHVQKARNHPVPLFSRNVEGRISKERENYLEQTKLEHLTRIDCSKTIL
uniref:Uncharacterized protein n=1 Tax=Arundo donax TaxID=35708 RepID=A0A0A9ES68_ARUDO